MGVVAILDEEKIEAGEEFFGKSGKEGEAGGGTLRHLAADENGFPPVFFDRGEKVGPEVAFDEDKEFWTEFTGPAMNDPAKIDRQVGEGVGFRK